MPPPTGMGGPGPDGGAPLDAQVIHDARPQPDGFDSSADSGDVDSGDVDSGSGDSGDVDSGSGDAGSGDAAIGQDGGDVAACGTVRSPSTGRTVLEMEGAEPGTQALP